MKATKKSFVAYNDWIATFEELTDEEAGKLVKHLFRYVNGDNSEAKDKLIRLLFIPIQQTINRDSGNWEKYIEKQRANGAMGGRPPKAIKPKPLSENPTKPKKADSDIATVRVSDNVSEFVNANDIKKHISSNEIWIEDVCNKKKLEKTEVVIYLKSFLDDLELKQELNKPEKEIKNHFVNWLNIKIKEKGFSNKEKQGFSESVLGTKKHSLIIEQIKKKENGTNEIG